MHVTVCITLDNIQYTVLLLGRAKASPTVITHMKKSLYLCMYVCMYVATYVQ